MKMHPQVKSIWLAALRSGYYSQGREVLRRQEKYCCFGVLCDLYDSSFWKKEEEPSSSKHGDYSYVLFTGMMLRSRTRLFYPPSEVLEWAGMSISRENNTKQIETLVRMNDKDNVDFNMIADYIEANL
jgi:hypothetical protein